MNKQSPRFPSTTRLFFGGSFDTMMDRMQHFFKGLECNNNNNTALRV